ncbi:hypothetical protein BDZ91DRAFT_715698 [Kalaharituber pfeilii]|nr:hypothetical protein BDZ91DRAFT_715698 [Kalaharituber pfeilii]
MLCYAALCCTMLRYGTVRQAGASKNCRPSSVAHSSAAASTAANSSCPHLSGTTAPVLLLMLLACHGACHAGRQSALIEQRHQRCMCSALKDDTRTGQARSRRAVRTIRQAGMRSQAMS